MKAAALELLLEGGVHLDPEADGLELLHRAFEGVAAEDGLVADAHLFEGDHL